jgi:hypothetical protein
MKIPPDLPCESNEPNTMMQAQIMFFGDRSSPCAKHEMIARRLSKGSTAEDVHVLNINCILDGDFIRA